MRASAHARTQAHALHRHLKSLLIFIGKVIAVKVAVGKQEQTNTAARGEGRGGGDGSVFEAGRAVLV